MSDWNSMDSVFNEYTKKHSTYRGIEYKYADRGIRCQLHPVLVMSQFVIDSLIEEGKNGFLLNPDVDELYNLLLQLPDYNWEQMGSYSRLRFENEFTFERMEKEFCQMYDKTLNS